LKDQQEQHEIQTVLNELNELAQATERAYQRWESLTERASA